MLDSTIDAPNPDPQRSRHREPAEISTALPPEVERRLAQLVGIEPLEIDLDAPPASGVYRLRSELQFRRRVLLVAQQVTLGGLLLLAACATVAARVNSKSLVVHSIPVMIWGLAAAVSAVSLAGMVTDPTVTQSISVAKRRAFGAILMAALIISLTGVVANADGVAGPAWVLFLPLVVVAGAVLGPTLGLAVGALAAGGIYAAAGFSHTLDIAGVGELIVILPACPLFGWAAGGLAGLAHDAVDTAMRQRAGLVGDVGRLSDLLNTVAEGDLSRVPALDNPADQGTATLAVVFADTVLSLRRLVRQMSDVADQLAGSATDLARTAELHVGTVEQQATAVAETTSTIEQLATTATTIASTALLVARYAGNARRDVDLGLGSVGKVSEAMAVIRRRVAELGLRTGRLDERVNRIATTTRLIDELARRTTMLAVNASIEAARVGFHGEGFASVASEIAALATKARSATADIASIVSELEAEVEATAIVSQEGIAAVEIGLERQVDVDRALELISHRVNDTSDAAERITDATRQQRVASDAVVESMRKVAGTSEGATSATRSHAASAARLRDLMGSLRETVGRFRLE
ncbi:MAG TPA: methyl-accepting chemotaxis protein [Mycobacteriales bacterium]|nr:methyl-accepting chemotaxis protein [Mycobacteriales bacterium]